MVERIGLDPRRIDVIAAGRRGRAAGAAHARAAAARRARARRRARSCCASRRSATHKNLAALVRAMPALADLRRGARAARLAHAARGRAARARRARSASRTAWSSPRGCPTPSSRACTGCAACFVLPSFEEGFGLPVLDAMRRGVPVACSNVSALPEVAGDAALLFDPYSDAEVDRRDRAACIVDRARPPSWSSVAAARAQSSRGGRPPKPRSRATGARSRAAGW